MKKSIIIGVASIYLIFQSSDCYAYLDPGTGSMLLQGLIAGIMVVGATIGIYWRRFKRFFTRNNKQNGTNDESS